MARRTRVDSIAAAKTIAAMAGKAILPPDHVTLATGDLPFWESVVAEFPKADWSKHQLEVAAQLAKAMADLESERGALRTEGYVLVLEGGKAMANPRHGIARDLTNSIMSLRRNLQLHARAQGEARDVGKRKAMARDIEAGVMPEADDDLLASRVVN